MAAAAGQGTPLNPRRRPESRDGRRAMVVRDAAEKARSLLLFLERLAERVRGVDAEDAQLLGKECQLLQGKRQ